MKKNKPAKPATPAQLDIVTPLHPRHRQNVELVKSLHLLARRGMLNQNSRRKLKQVYHLYQFIAPLLE